MGKSQFNNATLNAIDMIATARANEVPRDITKIGIIIDDTNKTRGEYLIAEGPVKYIAYSENTTYQKGDQVRIQILEGDYTTKKFILGKYALSSEDAEKIYDAPSSRILTIGNIVEKLPSSEVIQTSNKGFTEKTLDLSKIINLQMDSTRCDSLVVSGIFQTNCVVDNIIYGIKIDLYSYDIVNNNHKNVASYRIDSSEMFGDPAHFTIPSLQEKMFSIKGLSRITQVQVSLYVDNKENEQAIISLLDLKIVIGNNIAEVPDNTLRIFSLDNKIADVENSKKTISLNWYNKDENGHYLGFSDGYRYKKDKDGIYQDYDELEYIKLKTESDNLLSQRYRVVPLDKLGLQASFDLQTFKADTSELIAYMGSSYSGIKKINNLVDLFKKQQAYQKEKGIQNPEFSKFFETVLSTSTEAEDNSLYTIIGNLRDLLSHSEKQQDGENEVAIQVGLVPETENILREIRTALDKGQPIKTYSDNGYIGKFEAQYTVLKTNILEKYFSFAGLGVYTDSALDKKIADTQEKIKTIIIKCQKYLTNRIVDINKYANEDYEYIKYEAKGLEQYNNYYCLYWFKAKQNAIDDILGPGWERIGKNWGLPELPEAEKGNKLPMYPVSVLIEDVVETTSIKAVLFVNHTKNESGIISFEHPSEGNGDDNSGEKTNIQTLFFLDDVPLSNPTEYNIYEKGHSNYDVNFDRLRHLSISLKNNGSLLDLSNTTIEVYLPIGEYSQFLYVEGDKYPDCKIEINPKKMVHFTFEITESIKDFKMPLRFLQDYVENSNSLLQVQIKYQNKYYETLLRFNFTFHKNIYKYYNFILLPSEGYNVTGLPFFGMNGAKGIFQMKLYRPGGDVEIDLKKAKIEVEPIIPKYPTSAWGNSFPGKQSGWEVDEETGSSIPMWEIPPEHDIETVYFNDYVYYKQGLEKDLSFKWTLAGRDKSYIEKEPWTSGGRLSDSCQAIPLIVPTRDNNDVYLSYPLLSKEDIVATVNSDGTCSVQLKNSNTRNGQSLWAYLKTITSQYEPDLSLDDNPLAGLYLYIVLKFTIFIDGQEIVSYQPIPLISNTTLSFSGPTALIYDGHTIIANDKNSYHLYRTTEKKVKEELFVDWSIIYSNRTYLNSFSYPDLGADNLLKLPSEFDQFGTSIVYASDPLTHKVLWIQPIVTIMNSVPSLTTQPKKDISISNDLSFGNSTEDVTTGGNVNTQGTYTGYILGEVIQNNSKMKGLFGFSSGIPIYQFKDDGTFILGRNNNDFISKKLSSTENPDDIENKRSITNYIALRKNKVNILGDQLYYHNFIAYDKKSESDWNTSIGKHYTYKVNNAFESDENGLSIRLSSINNPKKLDGSEKLYENSIFLQNQTTYEGPKFIMTYSSPEVKGDLLPNGDNAAWTNVIDFCLSPDKPRMLIKSIDGKLIIDLVKGTITQKG